MSHVTRSPFWKSAALLNVVFLTALACGDAQQAPPTTAGSVPATSQPATPPAATTAPATSQPAPPAATTAPADSNPPAFSSGFSATFIGDRGDDSVDPGGVVFHDGTWHMFAVAEREWRNTADVWWLTSEDARKWVRQELLFSKDDLDLPYASLTLAISDATVLDDGTWVLYFYTIPATAIRSTGVIGRLSAPGPRGPWSPDPEPVLSPGRPGAWDSVGVGHPDVVRVGDEYWMYYDGHRGDSSVDQDRAIGLAKSSDGVVWIKHDDPDTTEPPYAHSDPVFIAGPHDTWDGPRVYDPGVVLSDEGFVMAYVASGLSPDQTCCTYARGLAFSDDGVNWTRDTGNPFFVADRMGFVWTGMSTLVHTGDRYVLLGNLEAGGVSGASVDVWAHVHEGPIRPAS